MRVVLAHGVRFESLHLRGHFLQLFFQLLILFREVKTLMAESVGGVGNFLLRGGVAADYVIQLFVKESSQHYVSFPARFGESVTYFATKDQSYRYGRAHLRANKCEQVLPVRTSLRND